MRRWRELDWADRILVPLGVIALAVACFLLYSTAASANGDVGGASSILLTSASVQQVADARGDVWRCQDKIDRPRTRASRSARSLARAGGAYRLWVRMLWLRRLGGCEERLRYLTLPQPGDWAVAVRVAQRVFPGTESWLLSCSKPEGGHGRWKRYGGGAYYPGYERTDGVGGWMQFRPSTIRDAWPKALAYTRSRGFIVPDLSWFEAWRSPLGQALSAAYYRAIEHSDDHHWAASVGSGC